MIRQGKQCVLQAETSLMAHTGETWPKLFSQIERMLANGFNQH